MYDPDTMPANLEEWNELITFKTAEGNAAYEQAVAEATTRAEAAYPQLPDSGDKPTLEDYIARAVSLVEPAPTRDDWEQHFRAAGYYPQEQPVFTEPELTPEQKLALARSMIDAETSAAILSGFDYEVNGTTYHFSYDAFDQQNFADTANACLLMSNGATGLPAEITWNAYHNGELVRLGLDASAFLDIYINGALRHKAICMEEGGARKEALA